MSSEKYPKLHLVDVMSSIFIKMVSPETDVFVLCVHLLSTLQHLPRVDMVFELYIKDRRLIAVDNRIAGRESRRLEHCWDCMATITKAGVTKLFMQP